MKGNNNSSANAFLVIVGMVAIITTSLFGGYKFATRNKQIDEKFTEVANDAKTTARDKWGLEVPQIEFNLGGDEEIAPEFVYTIPEKRSYQGPKIYSATKYLYNTDGRVLDIFAESTKYSLNFRTNIDHSEGFIVTDDNTLFYVNSDLDITRIADHVTYAEMCFDGGYGYYVVNERSYRHNLYIYDTSTGKSTMFAEDVYDSNVAMSPNGQTVVYYSSNTDTHGTFITNLDGEILGTIDVRSISPIAVSNDGSIVYYSAYTDDGRYFCHTPEGEIRLSDKKHYISYAHMTRDCKQVIYECDDNIWYYRAGEKKPKKILKDDRFKYEVCNVDYKVIGRYSDDYMIDSESFQRIKESFW